MKNNQDNKVKNYDKGWNNCKMKILEILKENQLGVGTYGMDERIEGIIFRLSIMGKIRKL